MSQPVREHWVLFLIEGIVLLFLGVLAVVIPPLATLTFTVFLGCLFFGQRSRRASHDIRRAGIMYALAHRQQLTGQWGWLLAGGLIDLALAALIIVGFPGSAAWAVGLLVGIDLIFGGTH